MGEKIATGTSLKILEKEDTIALLISFVTGKQKELLMANTQQAIVNAALAVKRYVNGSVTSIPDLANIAADISGTVNAVLLHDSTRKDLSTCLDILLNEAEKLLKAEQAKKEKNKRILILTSICNFVSDHAEEFIDMIPPEVFEV